MRSFICALALAAGSSACWAQAPYPSGAEASGPLTLETALALSAARHPALAAAAKEVDALQGGIDQAGRRPNPDVALRMEDNRRDSRTTGAEFGIPIELGGKRAARVTAAERARQVALAELALARAGLRATTVAAFFDVLIAQEAVALAQGAVAVADQALDVAHRRVAAGKVAPLEESRARVERANAELESAQAATRLANARLALASLWGDSQAFFAEASGSLDPLPVRPPLDRLLQALDAAPELVAGRREIERREAVVALERARRYPDIRVTAGMQRNEELGRNQALIGVAIPLPVFDRNQGNLYEATVRADQAGDQYAAVRLRLGTELRQAAARLALSRETAQALRTAVLPGAQQAYEVATKGFEAGKFGFLDVLDAQRTLFQARIRYLASLADTYQAAIAIDRILGR